MKFMSCIKWLQNATVCAILRESKRKNILNKLSRMHIMDWKSSSSSILNCTDG